MQNFEFNESQLNKLQNWQDLFCKVEKVYACCYDEFGNQLTKFSGDETEVAKIRAVVSDEQIQSMFRRVSESQLEDQALETTEVPNLEMAGIAVYAEGELRYVWIVFAVLVHVDLYDRMTNRLPFEGFSYTTTEKELDNILDLLRETTISYSRLQMQTAQALQLSEESRALEKKSTEQARRSETISKILELMDISGTTSGELVQRDGVEISSLMTQVLAMISEFVGNSDAFVCMLHKSDPLIKIPAQWCAPGLPTLFGKTEDLERFWFLEQDGKAVYSYDAKLSSGKKEFLEYLGITSITSIPIQLKEGQGFVCFADRGDWIWTTDDISFLVDGVRLLQLTVNQRMLKNSLAGSLASLQRILDNVGSSIYISDPDTHNVLFYNKSMDAHFHREIQENRLAEIFESAIPSSSHGGNYEIYYEDREKWYDLYYTRVTWVDGGDVELCAIYDSTEKKLYQKRIEQQAYTDFLTGLYNRMCCERDLAKYIDEAQQSGQHGAIYYLDLDDFKHINDGLGHQYGDVLLKMISEALQSIPAIHDTCYRMGGDEFVIIVKPDAYNLQTEVIRRIQEVFASPWYLKNADYYCTMSMGMVEYPDEGSNVAELIKKADIAMYEAKNSGKNQIAKYSGDSDSTSSMRLDMEKNMRDAVIRSAEEFEVYYQPIVDNTKEGWPCTGAEALVRWNSKNGLVSPADFIPLAEYLGLINPIGNHVLEVACRECKKWNDNGHPEFHVNVNLSVVQVLQPDIVDIIQRVLDETGLAPGNLMLEITESIAINDLDRTKDVLLKIKDLGCNFALDDFGTGYSSLNYIRALPLKVIKVDQNFVKDLTTDQYSQAFIRMIAELGDALGADICVEGIETESQLNILKGMRVKYIQGYYFNKPLPQADFEAKYMQLPKIGKKTAENE